MGLFSDEKKFSGSSSISQLGEQRNHKDTYFGELVLGNT
jgi:hypothetical protein